MSRLSQTLVLAIFLFVPAFAALSDRLEVSHFIFIPSRQNGPEGIDDLQFTATATPEPASMFLLSLGVGGLLALKRRKQFHKPLK